MARNRKSGLDWIGAAEPLLAGFGFFLLLILAAAVLAMLGVSALDLRPKALSYFILALYVLAVSGVVAGLPMSFNRYVGAWDFRRQPGGIMMKQSIQRIFGTRSLEKLLPERCSAGLERVKFDLPLWRPIIRNPAGEVVHAFPVAFAKPIADKMMDELQAFLSRGAQTQCVLEHAYATDRTRRTGQFILAAGAALLVTGLVVSRLSPVAQSSPRAARNAPKGRITAERRETIGTVQNVSLSEPGMRERKLKRIGSSEASLGCSVEISVNSPASLAGATVEVDASGVGRHGWCMEMRRMEGKQVRLKLTGKQTAKLFNTKKVKVSSIKAQILKPETLE